jgi:hypothetical protein
MMDDDFTLEWDEFLDLWLDRMLPDWDERVRKHDCRVDELVSPAGSTATFLATVIVRRLDVMEQRILEALR